MNENNTVPAKRLSVANVKIGQRMGKIAVSNGRIPATNNKDPISIISKGSVRQQSVNSELRESFVEYHHSPITVYSFRYYILLTECLLNLTNSFMFSSYAPVANYTDDYYGDSTTDYLSMIFLGISVPAMIVAVCVAQKAGLKTLIISSAFLNATGAGIRLLSNLDGISPDARLAFVLLGQAFGALANPGTLFLNTLIAATWFPTSQRAIATALLSVSTPLGMLVVSPVAPALVHQSSDLAYLNFVIFVPCAVVFAMTLLIRSSKPPSPPSHSANHNPMGTFEGIKAVFTNKNYMLLVVCLGIFLGLFNTLYTMIQQILCSRGYSSNFSALTFILLIGGGVIGSTIMGFFVSRTKLFEETIKVCVCLSALAGIAFAEFAIVPNMHAVVAVSMFIYGTFGLSYYAISMETSAEITYPVAETTSSGLIGLVGQLFGTIFIAIWNNLTQPLPDYLKNAEKCTVDGQTEEEAATAASDMKQPLFIFHALATLTLTVFVVFFKPTYSRLEQERLDIEREEEEDAQVTNEIIKMKF